MSFDLVGSIALQIAKGSDGGQAKWDHACRAQEQLQLCSSHISGGMDHVFVFGGLLTFGIWDGLSDVDFASINIEWWNQQNVREVVQHEVEKRSVHYMNTCLLQIGLPHKSMQALPQTRVPIVKHKGPQKGRSQIIPAKTNTVKISFNNPVGEINFELLQSRINVHSIPCAVCEPQGHTIIFVFNTIEETMKFALAVPAEVGEHKV
eukprot:PhF_6_TR9258/c2_g1_i1/m.14663